jgi:hypothetical protein
MVTRLEPLRLQGLRRRKVFRSCGLRVWKGLLDVMWRGMTRVTPRLTRGVGLPVTKGPVPHGLLMWWQLTWHETLRRLLWRRLLWRRLPSLKPLLSWHKTLLLLRWRAVMCWSRVPRLLLM